MITINHIQKQIKIKKQANEKNNKQVGSIIKYQRKEKSMTLHEASNGICSPSYLSKLENNQIVVSSKFLDPLLDRLEISIDYDFDEKSKKEIDKLIKIAITKDKIDENKIKIFKDRSDYRSRLYVFFYYAYQKKEIAFNFYKSLLSYIDNMTEEEIYLFLLGSSYVFFEKESHQIVFDISKLILDECDNEEMLILAKQFLLISALRMNKVISVVENFDFHAKALLDRQLFNLFVELKSEQLSFLVQYKRTEAFKEKVLKMNGLSVEQKSYIFAKMYLNSGDYIKAKQYSKDYYKNSNKWLTLYLMILDKLREVNKINEIYEKNEKYQDNVILEYLHHKYSNDEEQLFHFLKYEIGENRIKTDEQDILAYLLEDTKDVYKNYRKYKCALNMQTVLQKKLKLIRND